jgi:tripartite-type tricarboxylate transporter receptor subunit TctC
MKRPDNHLNRRTVLTGLLAAPAILRVSQASAQAKWPAQPIHMLVPYGPGGAADTVCRTVFTRVSEILGQPFVIENRTGGNTVVAASATLQAPPDGYTVMVNSSQVIVNPILMTDVPFDFRTAFVPITKLSSYPQVLAVRTDFPAQTLADYVEYARQHPGDVTCGTPPSAGMGHMACAQFQRLKDIKLEHVPYRIATEAARDVAGGTLDSVFLTVSTIQPPLQSGKVRILAVTSARRVPTLPDKPTFAENGMPGFDMDDWNGLFAAKGVPDDILAKMQAAIAEACKDPAVVARLTPLGTQLVGSTTAQFEAFLKEQTEVLSEVIRQANIKLG